LTVPVELLPPLTLDGLSVTDRSAGGLTVTVACSETPLRLPVIVTPTCAATAVVLIVKVAEDLPAGMVTVAGTVAAFEPLESFTTSPPEGAGPLSVAVPVEGVPPVTVAGLREIEVNAGGSTVRVAFCVTPLRLPDTVATTCDATATVVALKVALVELARIATEAGTATVVRLLESLTTNPPVGAGALRLTVPVEGVPPATVFGLKLSDAKPTGTKVRFAVCEPVPKVAVIVATV